jgi:Ser/Thr protein kinase RdoA (MazF antagonist)
MDETEVWLTHWRRGRDVLLQTFINPCPEVIITHLCSLGLQCNGTFLQHRSLENRVYAYGLEGGGSIVVKLYRPGSWSRAAIEEEHLFLSELRAAGLDVACPIAAQDGATIGEYEGILYAIFESIDGKPWLQAEHGVEDCRLLGRLLARIHEVGTHGQLRHRRPIKPHGLLQGSLRFLVEVDAIHPLVRNDYIDLVQHLSALIAERCDHQQTLRIHGDFGHWNMLWADDRPVVFDFDDMAMGIAAQDLALLMNSLDEQTVRLAERQGIDHSPFIEGYREIRSLDSPCAALLNPLLALRVVHINAWAASRIFDPAFQTKFSDFRSVDSWSRSIARMRQCLSRVEV